MVGLFPRAYCSADTPQVKGVSREPAQEQGREIDFAFVCRKKREQSRRSIPGSERLEGDALQATRYRQFLNLDRIPRDHVRRFSERERLLKKRNQLRIG